ncbi:MAG: hypothetical protein IPK71_14875 [Myxococcales bacterium]|nr:hypothetical protein [Myxococcales bacterium]
MRFFGSRRYARYSAFFGALSLGCCAFTLRKLAAGELPRAMVGSALMAAAFGLLSLLAVRRAVALGRGSPPRRE